MVWIRLEVLISEPAGPFSSIRGNHQGNGAGEGSASSGILGAAEQMVSGAGELYRAADCLFVVGRIP